MDMKPQYSSLAYSTRTEDIVDSSINSVLTTTLLKSREREDDMHRTLTIEEVSQLTEPNKPCVIIDQTTLIGKDVRPNTLFGNLRLMEKSVANVNQLHEGRLKDLTYQLISLGGSPDFTQEWIAKNEELYANSLANTCLKKLLAPNNGMDEFILQQAIQGEVKFQKQLRRTRKRLKPNSDRFKLMHLFHKNAINSPFDQLGIIEFEMMLVQWCVSISSKTRLTEMFLDIQKKGDNYNKGYITLDEFLAWYEEHCRHLPKDGKLKRRKWKAIRSGRYDILSARLAVIQACVGRAKARGRKLFRMIMEHFRASFPQHASGNTERNFTVSPAAHSVASSTAFRSNASFAMSLLTGDSSSSASSIFSASTALSQRKENDVNRMFIDAYEDSMNVNSVAGSIAGARKPKNPWPPTIDSHSRGNSIGRYTDDEAYADDEDNNSTAVGGHYNAVADGDYSDAYDPPQDQSRSAKGSSRPLQFSSLHASPASVRSEATLVDDNASAYTTDIEAEPAYIDALRNSPPKTRSMNRAGEMVKSMWEYQGEDDDELSFPKDAIIQVIGKADDGWWEGVYEGQVGYFPGNYVSSLDE